MRFRHTRDLRALVLAAGGLSIVGACFVDLDPYDPRLGTGGDLASGGDATGGGDGGTGAAISNGGSGATGGTGEGGSGATGGGATGGGGSGGGVVTPCGTVDMLADDFDDNTLDAAWYCGGNGGAVIDEEGGERVVTLPSDQLGSSWAGCSSAKLYDFRGRRAVIDVPTMVDTTTTANAFLHVVLDNQNFITVGQRFGSLLIAHYLQDTWTEIGSVPYDSSTHRYWQIREENSTVFWETSPDGSTFTTHATRPVSALFPMDLVQVEFGGSTEGGEVDPGKVHYDNLLGGMSSDVPWCKTDTLADDFDDNTTSRMWAWDSYEGGGCTHEEKDGQLVFDITGGPIDCAYVSAQRFDLEGSSMHIEVPTVTSMTTSYLFYRLEVDSFNGFEFIYESGTVFFKDEVAGALSTHGSVIHGNAHRFWRLREDAGTTYWETSPDGAAWAVQAQVASTVPPDALAVVLGVGTNAVGVVSDSAVYDNLNTTP